MSAKQPMRPNGGSLLGNIYRLVYPTLFVFALALVVLFAVKTHLPLIMSKVALFSAI